MASAAVALQVIESLRKGHPPQRGVELYAVGHDKLMAGIKKFHLSTISSSGIIRFISGSWGSGKTHFFRLLREVALNSGCLVSNVELNVTDAALNRFESVFCAIIRNMITPSLYQEGGNLAEAAPFGRVLREALTHLGGEEDSPENPILDTQLARAIEALMADRSIDIDFKKMVKRYWETYAPESATGAVAEQTRAEILQWFSGEGTIGSYRKRFDVNKTVSKESAKLMLQSLAGFVRLSGYRGLVVLFDEAEQAYSVMRRSALRDAQNNLLSLINNIESLPGLFLVYATTPDFYTDPKHGIVTYGALQGRIGKPEERSPSALDTIWNLDEVKVDLGTYHQVAQKIAGIYRDAYPDSNDSLPSSEEINRLVSTLYQMHPSVSAVRFWRVLVTAIVAEFDARMMGEARPVERLYDDVMTRLREA